MRREKRGYWPRLRPREILGPRAFRKGENEALAFRQDCGSHLVSGYCHREMSGAPDCLVHGVNGVRYQGTPQEDCTCWPWLCGSAPLVATSDYRGRQEVNEGEERPLVATGSGNPGTSLVVGTLAGDTAAYQLGTYSSVGLGACRDGGTRVA